MHIKYSWVIILAMMFLSIFKVKAQETERCAVFMNNLIHESKNPELQLAKSSFQFIIPELRNVDNDFLVIPFDKYDVSFSLEQVINYSNNLPGDSSLLFLPAYPGLGDYQNFGGTLGSFNIKDKLTLNYGAFISNQYGYLLSSGQIVFGGNFILHYKITNKLQFQTWGQYVTPGNSSDPVFKMRTVFPTTKFGTGLQYNSNNQSTVKVGVEYEYDSSDKVWKAKSGGKLLLKF
ncbi:MAG: hypothetical protein R6V16_12030 [Bacteroidales bacterium]